MSKTNAVRILESRKLIFELIDYEVSEDALDAVSVANKVGMDPDMVFKTLVSRNESNKIFVFVIPGFIFLLHLRVIGQNVLMKTAFKP